MEDFYMWDNIISCFDGLHTKMCYSHKGERLAPKQGVVDASFSTSLCIQEVVKMYLYKKPVTDTK